MGLYIFIERREIVPFIPPVWPIFAPTAVLPAAAAGFRRCVSERLRVTLTRPGHFYGDCRRQATILAGQLGTALEKLYGGPEPGSQELTSAAP